MEQRHVNSFFFFFISINSHRLLLVVKYLIIISYLVRLRPKEHLRFFFFCFHSFRLYINSSA